VHCGPWFCASSMGYFSEISAQPGVPGSPASQPAAVDLKGSDAMTLISTWLHCGHSNNRCSKPIGPGETRSSIIRVWQCEQRRRSVRSGIVGMRARCFPCIGRKSITDLSVADSRLADAMEPVLPNTPARGWSILITMENFVQQEWPQCGRTLRPSMQDALGRKAIHAALRPLTNICSVGVIRLLRRTVLEGRRPLTRLSARVHFRSTNGHGYVRL
jgi:hypothetical protein